MQRTEGGGADVEAKVEGADVVDKRGRQLAKGADVGVGNDADVGVGGGEDVGVVGKVDVGVWGRSGCIGFGKVDIGQLADTI